MLEAPKEAPKEEAPKLEEDESWGNMAAHYESWEDTAVYCEICEMWLKRTQCEDHMIGKKHKKNLKKRLLKYLKKTADQPDKTHHEESQQPVNVVVASAC